MNLLREIVTYALITIGAASFLLLFGMMLLLVSRIERLCEDRDRAHEAYMIALERRIKILRRGA